MLHAFLQEHAASALFTAQEICRKGGDQLPSFPVLFVQNTIFP